MNGRLRLAVAQAPAALDTTAARLDWLRGQLPKVVEAGAELLLLPELFACGYNIGAAVRDRAEPANGPTARAVTALAREAGLAIHYGFAERAGEVIHNSALCIAADGAVLTHQRKLAIPPGFEREYFTPGSGCRMFAFNGFTVATLICYDAEFPETLRHVAAAGADVVLVPTALGAQWGVVAHRLIPTRAFENGVFLAYANSAGVENGLDFLGASCIVNPDGTEAARAGAEPEVILADLDVASVRAARARLPYLQDRLSLSLG